MNIESVDEGFMDDEVVNAGLMDAETVYAAVYVVSANAESAEGEYGKA